MHVAPWDDERHQDYAEPYRFDVLAKCRRDLAGEPLRHAERAKPDGFPNQFEHEQGEPLQRTEQPDDGEQPDDDAACTGFMTDKRGHNHQSQTEHEEEIRRAEHVEAESRDSAIVEG
jgi:hypothetical protein